MKAKKIRWKTETKRITMKWEKIFRAEMLFCVWYNCAYRWTWDTIVRARTHTIYVYIWAVSTHNRTQICSYQSERRALTKRNRQKHSYGCNMYCTEQQAQPLPQHSKWRQPKETTIWICTLWVVTNVKRLIMCKCVLCTVSHRSYSCCIVVGIAWFSLVLLVICSAVTLCASHYLQLRSARIALCAAVHVLVSMPFTESNERKAHTKYKTYMY